MRRPSSKGFTLIELMVVVAVIAILASIALPSYQDSVRKGRRGQAKADLVEVGQLAERYRTVNSTYSGFSLPAGFDRSPRTGTSFYAVALDIADGGRTYTATATPVAAQAADRCGALALLSTGARFHERGESAECGFGIVGPPSD
ncbi:type IV pilin protein [Luteimonas yindakuii]|uniref:type IV pilin protein n=1 Tax=Luteimonas yindakuii TaxID=2565782 RepID=UPI0010A4F1D5|nr:type IV pilin protein [Luteimonas yindakuii]QCO68129.1 type IV pilin protein [Luteimonas yindakuii]